MSAHVNPAERAASDEHAYRHKEVDFSLVLGGPLYQFLLLTRLTRPTMELVPRRVIFAAVLTWLPLAILTAAAGTFLSQVNVPFLFDLDVHVKFLLTVPILIGAELIVHRRVRALVEQFLERKLIRTDEVARFEALVTRAMRMRNSVVAEIVLIVLSFTLGSWIWRTYVTLNVATWYATPAKGDLSLTGAGWWYAYVSLPIARFILLRWYYRFVIWYVFMGGVARLRLNLNPLHPDRAGGLGFVSGVAAVFAPILFAQTTLLAGVIGNQIWHDGAKLPDFKFEIAGFVIVQMLLVLLPLTFFVLQLAAAKLAALRDYGLFASHYVNDFRQKWFEGQNSSTENSLGSGDIQSLADLGNSFEVARSTGLLPFGKGLVFRLAIVLCLPLLPLTLTMIPLEELVSRLAKLLL